MSGPDLEGEPSPSYEGTASIVGGDFIYTPNKETDPEKILVAAILAKKLSDPDNKISVAYVVLPELGEVWFDENSTLASIQRQREEAGERERFQRELLSIAAKISPDRRDDLLAYARGLAESETEDR